MSKGKEYNEGIKKNICIKITGKLYFSIIFKFNYNMINDFTLIVNLFLKRFNTHIKPRII